MVVGPLLPAPGSESGLAVDMERWRACRLVRATGLDASHLRRDRVCVCSCRAGDALVEVGWLPPLAVNLRVSLSRELLDVLRSVWINL